MSAPKRYLCVCQYGHSRSVCLTRVLHGRGDEAVAVGWMTSGSALDGLAEWADTICVLEAAYASHVPSRHLRKVVVLDVGRDRWSNPYHPELFSILSDLVSQKL